MRMDVNLLDDLNENYKNKSPQNILRNSIQDVFKEKLVYVSSFGTESAIILHMISKIDNHFPIIMLNTNFLYEETIDYKKYLLKKGKKMVLIIKHLKFQI